MARRKSKLWIYIAVAVSLLGYMIFMIANVYIVRNQLRQFAIDYSDSIQYGIENDCLRVEYDGEVTRLIAKNANSLFKSVANSNYAKFKKKYEAKNGMFIDFGNGDTMWLYPYDNESVIYHFVYASGKERTYITRESTRMVTFERLVSLEWGNEPWNN